MAPTTDVAKAQFEQRTNELDTKTKDCVSKFEEVVKKINDALNKVNWFTDNIWFLNDEVDSLRDKVKEVATKLGEMRDKMFVIIRGSVPVLSLYDAAFRWTTDLQAPISGLSGRVNSPEWLSLRGQWEGPASLAYFTVVIPLQVKAVDGLSATASATSKWLAAVATSNLEFMLKILKLVVEVLEKIIAALTAGATVAGLLEAIGRIGDALGKSTTAIYEILSETASHIGKSIEQANAALNIVNDNGPFPGGNWPNPVTI
jgi:hypothetical protein